MRRRAALVLVLALTVAGCAGTRPGPGSAPAPAPVADSLTLVLHRLDETGGTRALDAGPYRLHGDLGPDTRPEPARFRGGRRFDAGLQSWMVVDDNPALDSSPVFTVEAWVLASAITPYELSVIAARWTPESPEQSWVLGLVGLRRQSPAVSLESPGYFREATLGMSAGRLVFVFRPDIAAPPRGYASVSGLPLERWTHVAVSVDGEVVRFHIDGRLDAQHVVPGPVRRSAAPLVLGALLDPMRLNAPGGERRLETSRGLEGFYSLQGVLDEFRLSSGARTRFESTSIR